MRKSSAQSVGEIVRGPSVRGVTALVDFELQSTEGLSLEQYKLLHIILLPPMRSHECSAMVVSQPI